MPLLSPPIFQMPLRSEGRGWRTHFNADRSVVGRSIIIDGKARTIEGIHLAGFTVPVGSRVARADIWMPLRFTPDQRSQRRTSFLNLLRRLAPGASVVSAHEELTRLFDGIVAAHPELRGESVWAIALEQEHVRTVRSPLLLLFG